MTAIATLNSVKLGQMVGREINDATVLVAKNLVLGNDEEGISQVLGCSKEEVEEIKETQDFKDVYLILAAHYNAAMIQTDLNYDDIEQMALEKLSKRLETVKDVDQLVRIATMANRAQRRNKVSQNDNTLDPSKAGNRVGITLTRRLVEKLTNSGVTKEQTEQISIRGNFRNPNFSEVDEFLGGINKPRIPENYQPAGEMDTSEVTLEALQRIMHKDKKS